MRFICKTFGFVYIGMIIAGFLGMLSPVKAAEKSLSVSFVRKSAETGQRIEAKVYINTGGEKVGTVGFDIEFPTEILEGSTPMPAGSVFPMSGGTQSSTRYECGIVGKEGFTGSGLVTTLVYTTKSSGTATISIKNFEARFGPVGALVPGFTLGEDTITIYDSGQTPVTEDPGTHEPQPSEKLSPQESKNKPNADAMTAPVQKNIEQTPGTTRGSTTQTPGKIGALQESPIEKLKPQEISVKGLSFKNPMVYGFFPTILLLALVINMGIKLYFSEKRRHLELVHLFDTQIGTLSSLESKLDLVDGKSEEGKERILQEFEEAKQKLSSQEK
jgi:hypothetical protein